MKNSLFQKGRHPSTHGHGPSFVQISVEKPMFTSGVPRIWLWQGRKQAQLEFGRI